MNDSPTRRLESLHTRGGELGKRLAALEVELAEAAGADDDPLLSQLLAERSTLQAKIEACSRSIAAARSELSEEGRAERRAQIEAVEAQARAALEQDAHDAGHIEALLDDLSETLSRMHARGSEVRRALVTVAPRTLDGARVDFGLADDLAHVSGTLGELLRSELARRGVFDTVAPRAGRDWNPRPLSGTMAEHFAARAERQGRRVARVIDSALQGV